MAQAFFVYSPISRNSRDVAIFDYPLAGVKRAGAHVMTDVEFLAHAERGLIGRADKVVNFFVSELGTGFDTGEIVNNVWSVVEPSNRWVYMNDTRTTPDGQAYTGRIEQCRRFGVSRAIVTYSNVGHLECLRRAGITYVTFPFCVSRRRARTAKPHVAAMLGSFDPETYPTRSRLRSLLSPAFPPVVLDRPVVGDTYYDVLDGHRFGLVCRGGYRDAFVAKYVEYGMCHVLPVGDCPSYMPVEMKQAMVNVEGRSDEWVVSEVTRLLRTPDELFQRQEAYSEQVHRRFDLLENARRVVTAVSVT